MSKREGAAALHALKIAPPRANRWLVSRERLVRRFQSVRESALICVQAPAGYGKTSLLARLRREWLAAGAYAAWLSLDEGDDAGRFLETLLLSTYTALGRPAPMRAAEQALRSGVEPRDSIAALVGELAEAARPVALVLDDLHLVPESVASELLPHLAFNLPPNVYLIIGTRRRPPFPTSDLLAHGQFVSFDAGDLRFRLDETRALLHARCGEQVDADTVARVHERVEGWPMGLQLMLINVEKEANPVDALRRAAATGSGLDTLFSDLILPRLDPQDAAFLTSVAPLEELQPHLCAAMTGRHDCAEVLARLRDDTPTLNAVEGSEWLRLHATCREVLLRRFGALPKADQLAMHWRAAQWLQAAGMLERAAHHALAAERHETAYAWIGQALYGLATSGRALTARAWLERLPKSIVFGDDRLRLVAAWTRALSDESREAFDLCEPLLGPQVDPALRYEALQVRGAAAHYTDDLVAASRVSEQVGEDNPFGTPVVRAANAVLRSILALSGGDTVQARAELSRLGLPAQDGREDYANYYAEFFAGLSYLLDARPVMASRGLSQALARADSVFGRRSPPACLVAAALGAALLEQDEPDAAEATLADRLDVIERTAVPEAITLAYLTLARIGLERANLGRTRDLLEGLYTLGVHRRQPRMIAASLAEAVHVEASLQHSDACARAITRLRAQRAAWHDFEHGVCGIIDWMCGVAEVVAALCARDAQAASEGAAQLLRSNGIGWARGRLEVMALQFVAERMLGKSADHLRRELEDVAAANGLVRLLRKLQSPGLGVVCDTRQAAPRVVASTSASAPAADVKTAVIQTGLLTVKEREVLALLAHNYSNKEIARALDVGPATVKWHVRNLFSKLNVGSRRHAVQRARVLHLVATETSHP